MDVAGAIAIAIGVLATIAALRARARRLQPRDVVMLAGRPHTIAAVDCTFDWPPKNEYYFEPLGETLARNIRIDHREMSLGQLLVEEGWRPPPEGGPR